ncbi:MAG TPA: hypothetical protein PKK60_04220 [archaeon]|nr:hypothetical protein [archaeon]
MMGPGGFRGVSKKFSGLLKRGVPIKKLLPQKVKEKRDRQIKLVALVPLAKPNGTISNPKRNRVRPTPSIAQLMDHLNRTKYHSDLITRKEQGFVIKLVRNWTKYQKYFEEKKSRFVDPKLNANANRERLRIIQQLGELGFRVAIQF